MNTRTSARGQYTSQVALVDGEIGTDLAHFLEQSEQIRSAALVGVLPRSVGIAAAGGMLVEAMPGVEDIAVTGLERNLRALGGRVSSVLEAGGIDALTQRVLDGFQLETLETHALRFACRCDREMLRLRVTQALAAEASTDDLFDADERCEVVCQRCAERFVFTRAELMHDAADAAPS
ncbi:MAG: Hsp33 family molecular chaperone HslO [Acidobacteriota bacterium]